MQIIQEVNKIIPIICDNLSFSLKNILKVTAVRKGVRAIIDNMIEKLI